MENRNPIDEERKADFLRQEMATRILSHCEQEGDFATTLPDLALFRRDKPSDPAYCLIEPSVVMVVEGVKQMVIGDQAFPYDESNFLITSLNLPGSSQVISASKERPCVGLVIKLDIALLSELIAQQGVKVSEPKTKGISASLGEINAKLLSPCARLIDLLDEPEAADMLAPMIKREIHYRLLASKLEPLLRQIASVDGQAYRIARVVDWLKVNFHKHLRIEELSEKAQMSSATLHLHFRQLTGMSPLQYQKWLRLNEAKRLMLTEGKDASAASYDVGYESPSQFSREYSRLFGLPPRKDIEMLRKAHAA